jgi:phosphoenolpyruvate-protein kinase (PTS system EI component)
MVNQVNSTGKYQPVYSNDKKAEEKQQNIQKDETGVILELGNSDVKSATYSKPAQARDSKEISRLWKESEKAHESLRSLVENLLLRQGKKIENVFSGKDMLFVDAEARAEAEKLVAEDGELGVKAVSDRIVNFAKALSGGDKSKLDELRAGIEKGFRQAERAFGGKLPDISKATYDEVMKKLDEWENEE